MKNRFLILGLINTTMLFSHQALAISDCAENEANCWDCGKEASDLCTARRVGQELQITGTGEMKNYEWFKDANHTGPYGIGETTVPWGYDYTSVSVQGVQNIGNYAFVYSSVQNVDISDSVTSIGASAMNSCYELQNVNIPSSVTDIGERAFAWSPYYGPEMSLVIPASVTSIGSEAFRDANVTSLVIEGSPTIADDAFLKLGMNEYKTGSTSMGEYQVPVQIYCPSGIACTDKGQNADAVTIVEYTKDDATGIYQTEDGKYFASAALMGNGTACTSLENCQEIIAAQNAGTSFKVGSKIYNSMEDFAKGNHVKYRIYTVEEANRVAGDVNRVTIRYK